MVVVLQVNAVNVNEFVIDIVDFVVDINLEIIEIDKLALWHMELLVNVDQKILADQNFSIDRYVFTFDRKTVATEH